MIRDSTILVCLLAAAFLSVVAGPAEQPSQNDLPKVVLLGDSIRLGYAPLVKEQLKGEAQVISPEPNGEDSGRLLQNLDEWVIRQDPDVVHLNAGLHDLRLLKQTGRHQVEQERYEANLQEIIGRLRNETKASLIFASTTPILDSRHARRGLDYDRYEADVVRYNQVAVGVMRSLQVPINDLHWLVEQQGTEAIMLNDGTHFTVEGYEKLAAAVADSVRRELKVRNYRPLPSPAKGPEAAADYRQKEAEGDALVPEVYRRMRPPELHFATDPDAWQRQRPDVRETVLDSLGDLPARPAPLKVRRICREIRTGYSLESVRIDNGVDSEISALLLVPDGLSRPAPAVLWLHSSTPDKTQIIIPQTNGGAEALGETLVRAGYVVLSPDAYWHGDRVGTGPAGLAETGRQEQESLLKLNLWMGRTLWGMFVRDDRIALDYLYQRPEVDKKRIGATGMSMGSTRAWWLAAVDERVAAVVAVACLTRYQNLIAHGQLRAHGVYYFVDGLLKHFDTEGVLALIAPRPFLALTGELDAGSPADGILELEARLGPLYATLGASAKFRNLLYPEIGHTYTPEMRAEMLAWFDRWLRSAP
jgi:dienelactone hydrolase/lysophospholipase L1-like esterase